MANLSQIRREQMLSFLETLKEQHSDDESLIAINQIERELTAKKYGLVWEEHEEEVDEKMKTHIPVFTEDISKELIAKTSDEKYDFLLEGDNLHSLLLLEKMYKKKIGVIYIDPPYNTGSNDFMYDDAFIDNGDGYRHSKWLSFMHKRLLIAKKLLSRDGVIFISIDDNEFSQLKLICDEIFGEENRLSTHHIQVRYSNKSLNEDNDWQPVMEYVLIYAYDKKLFKANKPSEPYDLSKFCYEIKELSEGQVINVGNKKVTIFKDGEWTITKHDGRIGLLKETWASGSLVKQSGTAAEFLAKYLIQRKDEDGLNVLYKIDNMGEDGLGYRYVTGPKKEDAIRGKFYSGVPLERIAELEKGISAKTRPIPNLYDYAGDFGNIRHEGGMPFNSGKKPVKMLKELINYQPDKNVTVLDFFAGSGSTAQAVLELNQEDGGKRNYIICTNNQNNICEEITYERIKTVITGIKTDGSKYSDGIPANLKYYKTDFVEKDSENLYDDLLEHVVEMIQLQFGVKVDNEKYVIIMDDEEMDEFEKNIANYDKLEAVFINQDVLLSTSQEKMLEKVNTYIIPDCYFDFELREAGELW